MQKIKLILIFFTVSVSLLAQSLNDRFVNNVNYIGNESFSTSKLISFSELKPSSLLLFSNTPFDRRLLKLDAIALKNFYQSEGFLETTVLDSFSVVGDKVDIYFIVNEGKRYFLHNVIVNGLVSLEEKFILTTLGLLKSQPYNPVQINTNLFLVDEAFQEKGKLFAKYDIQQDIRDSVIITLNIEEGQSIYINNSWITDTELIDSNYVRNEFAFNKGDLFRKSLMDKTKRTLLQAGFFSSVSIITHPIKGQDNLINIEVKIREFQNRGVQNLDIGYEDIEYVPGVKSLVGVGGSIRWTDRMIFGTKNRFDATGSVVVPSEEGFIFPRFSVDTKFSNQRPFSIKIPTQVKIFYQQFKNFGDENGPYVRRFGLQYSNIFRWNKQRSYFDIGFRFELFDESAEFQDQIEQRKFKIHLHQDKRDNPMNPTQGNVLVFQLDAYGGPLGGNRSYIKYDFDFRQYISLFKNITIAGRINTGVITGWSSEYDQYETILFEKFYLGGSNTLRAWKPLQFMTLINDQGLEYPLGKTAKILTNWEVRFPLFWKLGGVLFYDGGYIADKLESIKNQNIEWNRGLGLTFNLPFGPIRIDYAESLNDPSIKQFNFGFLYSF
ncbi:MAG: BamA/OMP85 family outer membrane protein [Fidelibacterota bacterium]|jgi:outer membrane protein insertion porin family|tara:strand:+ start:1608 stop:3428 length:1821 start_codon:yes stop_codon:yes gene_type:complete